MSLLRSGKLTRKFGRGLLRLWRSWGRAPGYYYQAVEKYGASLAESKPLQAVLPNGLIMECDLRDHVQRQIYFHGVYEPFEAYRFFHAISPGAVVFDIGANVGQYSLLASTQVGSTGQVHAFEPVPKNFERSHRHLEINKCKNAQLNPFAAWHRREELDLGLAADMLDNQGSFSVGAASESAAPTVRAIALAIDDYIEERNLSRLDLIKMDIEGAELFALRGLRRSLERFRPIILMEINRLACERLQYTTTDLWNFLVQELGYTPWPAHGGPAATALDPAGIVQANFLFTPSPHFDDTPLDYKSCLRWAISRIALRT